jgi:hypothetical protein
VSAIFAECIAKKLDEGMALADVCETYGLSYTDADRLYMKARGKAWPEVPRHAQKVFTQDAIDKASSMWACGASIGDIATAFGVTYHCVEIHMSRHRERYPYRHDMSRRHKRGEVSE